MFVFLLLAMNSHLLSAQEHPGQTEEMHGSDQTADSGSAEFKPASYILEHIADSHEWHILTWKDGTSVSVYLPVIIYTKEKGLSVFSSRRLAHGHTYEGFRIIGEGEKQGTIGVVNDNGEVEEGAKLLDLSITKAVAAMMVSAIILLILFISLARSYRKSGISEPKGIQGLLEPVIMFVKDDIAVPNIGEEKFGKYMPYLLTVFFFILANNLMGLIPIIPGGANVTGNIAVTFTLAAMTGIITNFSGNRGYWRHIFNTPGVPWWLKVPIPLMPVVELIGVVAKPFALMIRLFANMTAGHIVALSLVSLIFIFKSVWISPVSVLFVIFMDCLEILVAFLQAYVFTLLSALFIGLAVEEHH